jgi:hypothetical protein
MPYAQAMDLGRKQDDLLLEMVQGNTVEEIDLTKVMEEVKKLA